MPASFRRETLLAVAASLVRFAVCCYRAAHQAVIIDEATTYLKFVSGPWKKLFGRYDANNHILSSVLIKASVTVAGLSEFTLRLPSVIAGFLLVLGVFFVLKRLKSPLLRWAAFALVCLNPMLFDFSIAARGYGLCLAFFIWALYFAMEGKSVLAGCLLGLSVAANLTILFPVLALIVAVAVADLRLKPVLYLIVPAFVLAACFTYPSLRRSQRDDFYIGYTSFQTAFTDLVRTTLYAKPDTDGFLRPREKIEAACVFLLPAALLLAAAASFRARDRRSLLPLWCLIITLLGLVLAHRLLGLNYPAERTCLYFIALAAISWAVAGDALHSRISTAVCLLPMILLSVQFATQLQTRYFQFWWPEADENVIARLMQRDAEGKPDNSLSVSATWLHQPSLEFYRRYLHIQALKPVERLEPTPVTGYDFYVLGAADLERAANSHLRTVFSDPAADVTLAEP